MKGFKDFIMQGNVIDLAVAVVIGAAFGNIVTALVDGIITPLIAAAFNADSIADATVAVGPVTFGIGAVIAAIINFIAIAAVVYFVLVLPIQKAKEAATNRFGKKDEDAPAETEADVLKEIRDLLKAQKA